MKAAVFAVNRNALALGCLLAALTVSACSSDGSADDGPNPGPTEPSPATVSSVRLSTSSATLAMGQTIKVDATPLDAAGNGIAGKTVSWSSSQPSIVSVDQSGNLRGVSAGAATVTATVDQKTSTAAVTTLGFSSIQPGTLRTCALTVAGRLFCASAESGGLAKPEADPLRFAVITSHSEPQGSTVAHYCALTSDGTAYCWGSNGFGQLGTGDERGANSASPVTGGLKFRSISAGQHHTCGVTTAGDGYCWGEGASGQLGTGATANSSQPVPVKGTPKLTQIESGNFHSCALDVDGRAWCWGRNNIAQLGRGSTGGPESTPAPTVGTVRFQSLGFKWNWSCGLSIDGKAYCWGDNTLGQLGSVTSALCDGDKPCALVASAVNTSVTFASIAASQFSTCGIAADRQVHCWGGDMQNQFGASPPPAGCPIAGFAFGCTSTPTPGPGSMTSVKGSTRNYCGIATDNIAYCWGGNDLKQIGNPSVATLTAVPVVFSVDPASAQ